MEDTDWLGDLRWNGYPSLRPVRDVASSEPGPAPREPGATRAAGHDAKHPPAKASLRTDPRLSEFARENESLRARLEQLARLAPEFERRLSEAGAAFEDAALEADSRLRDSALERERLTGELEAAKTGVSRLAARDASREADLRLERERRAEAEKALLDARRKLEELSAEVERLRATASEQAGTLAELRLQASSQNERLVQSKALTDQDVRLLRSEMRDFLAKFARLPGPSARNP